jgi:hypothetical protein
MQLTIVGVSVMMNAHSQTEESMTDSRELGVWRIFGRAAIAAACSPSDHHENCCSPP